MKTVLGNKLLPCPFCPSKETETDYCALWTVICKGCGASGPPETTEKKAIKSWNRRPADEN